VDIAIEACLTQTRRGETGMSLEQLSYAAQVVGTVGVILSLVFVGLQTRKFGVRMTSSLSGEQA